MTSVVTLKPGEAGRHYRLPTDADYVAVRTAQEQVAEVLVEWERGGKQGLCPVPDEPTPTGGGSGAGRAFSVQRYGMMQWGDLFTARQKVALGRLTQSTGIDNSAIQHLLAIAADRSADYWSALCSWHLTGEKVNHTYGRQALPVIWDYTEVNPWCNSSGNYSAAVEWGVKTAEILQNNFTSTGQVQQANATDHPTPPIKLLASGSPTLLITTRFPIRTSPTSSSFGSSVRYPIAHYCAIRSIQTTSSRPRRPRPCRTKPKQANGRPKDREWFEATMAKAFAEGRPRSK